MMRWVVPMLLVAGLTGCALEPQEGMELKCQFTNSIGVELIAATSPHDLDMKGAARALGVGTAAESWLLPPTLLLQYHFMHDQSIRPYIGAGVNFTIVYGENATRSLEAVLGPTEVSADHSIGWAVQAGVDIDLDDRWFLNFDIKYIDLGVDVDLTSGATKRKERLDIDPIVVGVGFGYKF